MLKEAQGQCCVRYLPSTRVLLVDAPRCSQQDISPFADEPEKKFKNLLLAIFFLYLFIKSDFLCVLGDVFPRAEGSSGAKPDSDHTLVSAFF